MDTLLFWGKKYLSEVGIVLPDFCRNLVSLIFLRLEVATDFCRKPVFRCSENDFLEVIKMTKDSQSRKWQITINNPLEKGFTHEHIKNQLAKFKSCIYWCMSDEIGSNENTPHTHVFMACSSAVRFSTLLNRFEGAHFEMCKGTSQQNRDYVYKEGKFKGSTKEETRIEGTQEEWGNMPVERQGVRNNDYADLFDMIKSGLSDYQILEICPEQMININNIAQTRQIILQQEFENEWRDLDITYIYGDTGTGKTRYVMEKYGYANVYRITNYKHPFDGYKGQDVIFFDEFRSSLPLSDMLKYLDGYPCELPARFSNKQACYTKVYFATNIPLNAQYPEIQRNEIKSWQAFVRRIGHIHVYEKKQCRQMTLTDYLESDFGWIPANESNIFKGVPD